MLHIVHQAKTTHTSWKAPSRDDSKNAWLLMKTCDRAFPRFSLKLHRICFTLCDSSLMTSMQNQRRDWQSVPNPTPSQAAARHAQSDNYPADWWTGSVTPAAQNSMVSTIAGGKYLKPKLTLAAHRNANHTTSHDTMKPFATASHSSRSGHSATPFTSLCSGASERWRTPPRWFSEATRKVRRSPHPRNGPFLNFLTSDSTAHIYTHTAAAAARKEENKWCWTSLKHRQQVTAVRGESEGKWGRGLLGTGLMCTAGGVVGWLGGG